MPSVKPEKLPDKGEIDEFEEFICALVELNNLTTIVLMFIASVAVTLYLM